MWGIRATPLPQPLPALVWAPWQPAHELTACWPPGFCVLQAAVVAALRRDIADLRAELQAELGLGGANAAVAAASRSAFPTATNSLLESAVAAGSSGFAGSGRVLDALKLVEAQLAVSRQAPEADLSSLTAEEQQELLRLQVDNMMLK